LTRLRPAERLRTKELQYVREYFAQIYSQHFRQKKAPLAAARELLKLADVNHERAELARSSEDRPDSTQRSADLRRQEAGTLMNVADEFQNAADFRAAAAAAARGANALAELIPAIRDDRDTLNYLLLADAAARYHAAAGAHQSSIDQAKAALQMFATHPISTPELQNYAKPMLQSLKTFSEAPRQP